MVFSEISYELLQGAAAGDGVPVERLTITDAAAAWWLSHIGLVVVTNGRVIATTRGEVVALAEREKAPGGLSIRVRAGALWETKLSKRWAALNPRTRIPWGDRG